MSGMNNPLVQQKLGELRENIDEIMSSTKAVKGEAFHRAVAVNFEAVQAMEVIARLAALANEDMAEYAESLVNNGQRVLISIVAKACHELSSAQLEEAVAISSTLNRRRFGAIDAIRKGMQDDSH